jgi:hypothetical protein
MFAANIAVLAVMRYFAAKLYWEASRATII